MIVVSNGNGFVELVDVMGNDQAVIDAVMEFWGNDQVDPQKLIDFMFRQKHFSPFEMCELKFKVRMTFATMAKLLRHRTATTNIASQRYATLTNEFFDNPQPASDHSLDVFDNQTFDIETKLEPVYVEAFWKLNLRNFLYTMYLRLSPEINDPFLTMAHPQREIYEYAQAMYTLVKAAFPMSCAAFEKHELNAVCLNAIEAKILSETVTWTPEMESLATQYGLSQKEILDFKSKI
jgi:thymidylate synthase ThyX